MCYWDVEVVLLFERDGRTAVPENSRCPPRHDPRDLCAVFGQRHVVLEEVCVCEERTGKRLTFGELHPTTTRAVGGICQGARTLRSETIDESHECFRPCARVWG